MMVSKILRLLEAKGYVVRTRHPDDPRANRVDLTRSGRAAIEQAIPLMWSAQEAFFGRLSEEGRRSLAEQLDALMAFERGVPDVLQDGALKHGAREH